jgi:hypothetical protein
MQEVSANAGKDLLFKPPPSAGASLQSMIVQPERLLPRRGVQRSRPEKKPNDHSQWEREKHQERHQQWGLPAPPRIVDTDFDREKDQGQKRSAAQQE